MNDRGAHAKSIFLEALDQHGPDEVGRFLDRACGADTPLRDHVEQLLQAHEEAGNFLGRPVDPDDTHEAAGGAPLGTAIGPYKLLEQIGEGGMGLVYVAEQREPVKRRVALKIIKPGMDSRQVVGRFEAERQALAMMDHPNIAKVYDGGATAGGPGGASPGRPYSVMELVKGTPVTDYCDAHRLATRQRLALFLDVCQAVQHAHQKGIIHRDLKPSNVLVAVHDVTPVVKVIDFGIAKATAGQLTDKTIYTQFAQLVGSPLYMSPEQAGLSSLDVDTRSDVYSLGVLLYELLTGTTPFDQERLRSAGYDEMRRIIREEEPPRPSTRLSTLGQAAATVSVQRQSDPKRLRQMFHGELDWIMMKCLEKDRTRRYETASALAADVQRYLHDEPVQACPPSVSYRLRKLVQRNKALATAAASVVLALVVGTFAATWGLVRATEAEGHAQERLNAEKAARQKALAKSQKALDAVDQMLTAVGMTNLSEVPAMEPVRRTLLMKALKFYEGFLDDDDTDPELRRETAMAYGRVGEINLLLGRLTEAEEPFRRAVAMLEELAEEAPADPGPRAALVAVLTRYSWLQRDTGKQKGQLQSLRRAVDIGEKLVAEYPEAADYREWLARGYINLGGALVDEPDEAEKAFRQAITLSEATGNRYDLA